MELHKTPHEKKTCPKRTNVNRWICVLSWSSLNSSSTKSNSGLHMDNGVCMRASVCAFVDKSKKVNLSIISRIEELIKIA